eukprot:TRINITY_DN28899_c0_g1_i1.p1 TRINITY_DN28899_c0_g1~~TRINITY_DN28899_c0_g1_i1.p1  ORF type:complete len:615 (+),score=159.40 TRINITY_DN28899_c0_g1_i1:102-1847(+)
MDGTHGGLLHMAFGPMSSIVSAHYWNSTTVWDSRRPTMYHHSGTGRASTPRLVIVDWAGGSDLKAEWPLRAAPPDPADLERDPDPSKGEQWQLVRREPAPAAGSGDSSEDPFAAAAAEQAAAGEGANAAFAEAAAEQDAAENGGGGGGKAQMWWRWIVPALHDRTLQLFPDGLERADPAGAAAFSAFGRGAEALRGAPGDAVEDAVRFFAEEMDVCQGAVVLCDAGNAFGGMAQHFIDEPLRDVLGRKATVCAVPVWPFHEDEAAHSGAEPPADVVQEGGLYDLDRVRRWEQAGLNRALSHALLSESAQACLPCDATRFRERNPVDYAAYVSAALDTALTPCRLDAAAPGSLALRDWAAALRSWPALRLSQMSVALPFPLSMQGAGLHLGGALEQCPPVADPAFRPLWHPWPRGRDASGESLVGTPACAVASQTLSARGLHRLPRTDGADHHDVAARTLFAHPATQTRHTVACVSEVPFLVTSTFPTHLLSPKLNTFGWLDDAAPPSAEPPQELPVVSHCCATFASAAELHNISQRVRSAGMHRHADQGLDRDAWRELQENLDTLVDEYDHGLVHQPDDDD